MDSYKTFASVYDLFMDNVPYDDWCELYTNILKECGITDGILLDLGCGTGAMTRRFAKKGFDMIGIDASAEMLDMAREADADGEPDMAREADADGEPDMAREADADGESDMAREADADGEPDMAREADADESPGMAGITEAGEKSILYLQQDMRAFELYGTVAAVVSVCDSMNYILEDEDLLQVFKLVNNYLDPGGLFVFDMTTPYQYETVLGENSFCESRDEAAFLWENFFDEESRINEYDLTLFVREENDRSQEEPNNGDQNASENNKAERYRRFVETHYQRAWKPDEVKALLEESGLELLGIFGADGEQSGAPDADDEQFEVLGADGERPGVSETEEEQPGTLRDLQDTDERMYFVARECMKTVQA